MGTAVTNTYEPVFNHFDYEKEMDPNGLAADTPGAKLDAGKTRAFMVLGAFSRALLAVSDVGTFGANKYSDRGWEKVEDGYDRYMDALVRHLLALEIAPLDEQSGLPALAHMAWNALAALELHLRAKEKANGAA